MGVHYPGGYSADVEGFLVVDGCRIRVAKSNGSTFVLAEPCELAPHVEGELLVIIDGNQFARRVRLPHGVSVDKAAVPYEVIAPF